MFRIVLMGLILLAGAGVANAQPKKDPIPPPRPAGEASPTPGPRWTPYLPPRAVYGPSVSPLNYPYHASMPGYPYPGSTMVYPYPRTVSSYSFGPTAYPFSRGR